MRSALRTLRGRAPGAAIAAPAPHFHYRRLSIAELPRLNDLHNAYYRRNRSLQEAAWLYASNPNGCAVIYAAFDQRGELAGMRPAVPFRLWWDGGQRMAYELADALVDPRYQRRGIFSRLLERTCDWARSEGHVLYSLPNEKSLAVYRRMPERLQVLGDSCTVAKPLSWVRYAVHQLKRRGAAVASAQGQCSSPVTDGEVALRPVDRLDAGFDGIERALQERDLRFVLRTRAFLKWRYFDSPTRRYRVALVEERGAVRGYLVIRMVSGIAQVVDLFIYPDAGLARRTFALAAKWAEAMDASGIHFVCIGNALYREAAQQSGYWITRRSRRFVVSTARAHGTSLANAYFAMGDFDFF